MTNIFVRLATSSEEKAGCLFWLLSSLERNHANLFRASALHLLNKCFVIFFNYLRISLISKLIYYAKPSTNYSDFLESIHICSVISGKSVVTSAQRTNYKKQSLPIVLEEVWVFFNQGLISEKEFGKSPFETSFRISLIQESVVHTR